MFKFENFKVKESRGSIVISYNDATLASIKRETIEQVFKDFLSINNTVSALDKKALILVKDYNKFKKSFYKNRVRVINYTSKNNLFIHFKEAVNIIDLLETTNTKFLKAQIDGLKFINNGMGTFPKPNQLSTEKAEERTIGYLEKIGEIIPNNLENDLTGENEKVTISSYEKNTPLTKNVRYKKLLKKLRENKATLSEARYLKLCRKERKGDVGSEIRNYLMKLKKG